jgi:hypothetical protein
MFQILSGTTFSIAATCTLNGSLTSFFKPPLMEEERSIADMEVGFSVSCEPGQRISPHAHSGGRLGGAESRTT